MISVRSLLVLLTLTLAVPKSLIAQDLPSVNSAELVAHFVADSDSLTLGPSNEVLAWAASNDASMVLTTQGTNDPTNITFDPAALGGLGSLIVRDYSGDNRYLRGSLNQTNALDDMTIFWLGKYEPGADGSLTDSAGQYVYCIGPAGSQGSQLDHQIDDGAFEMYGGSGTQTGGSIAYLNGFNSVWRTEYYSGSPGHVAYVNQRSLNIPTDGGYAVNPATEIQLFGWQDSAAQAGGYNFVGEFAELVIYRGHLDSSDLESVHNYLSAKLDQPPPTPPGIATFQAQISGANPAGDGVADELYPHGNVGLAGTAIFTFDPNSGTMDWSIDLEANDANRYIVTQAHFYNLNSKPNGDSIFCWGGRWSNDEFLQGTGYSTSFVSSVLANPEQWVVMLHTEGGHFAVDEAGQLVEYNAFLHETSETGQSQSGDRYNNRVPRLLTNLLLREMNPFSGGFGDPSFDAVYPDPNHFLRENDSPFPDALGNIWIEWDAVEERYVPSAYGKSQGLTLQDIDTKEYLFYRYDDQGPSWDYGGPEGAAGGALPAEPVLFGDINRDGSVNLLDVDPFIVVLGSGAYQIEADTNLDGAVNLLDVEGFIAILGGE